MFTAEFKRLKSRRWWFKFPGAVYANNFDFERPVNVIEARAYVWQWLKVDRLPRGTEYWPGDH